VALLITPPRVDHGGKGSDGLLVVLAVLIDVDHLRRREDDGRGAALSLWGRIRWWVVAVFWG
jgi:hypothetical protein